MLVLVKEGVRRQVVVPRSPQRVLLSYVLVVGGQVGVQRILFLVKAEEEVRVEGGGR